MRVYVADDHPVYREGLVRAIRERPDLELVGEAADGREALPQISKRRSPALRARSSRMMMPLRACTRSGSEASPGP